MRALGNRIVVYPSTGSSAAWRAPTQVGAIAEAVIFIGLQGSGKTTYFTNHFAATHTHVSRDIQETAERERALIRECLQSERSFVVDNTNATRAVRAPYIREAKAAGFRVFSYFFDTPVRTAIGRNNHRKDKKPIRSGDAAHGEAPGAALL
ncbi:MAG: AAA family ATPase [Bryobacteraceae bacterium]